MNDIISENVHNAASSNMGLKGEFTLDIAVAIGIDRYDVAGPIQRLQTPVRDATKVAKLLATGYGYQTIVLTDEQATANGLKALFQETLPAMLRPQPGAKPAKTRLVFYFAGHGAAHVVDEGLGLEGFVLPYGASGDEKSFLATQTILNDLAELRCHHLLVILDCCFAGALRRTRDGARHSRRTLTQARYDYYTRYPAALAFTSAAYNERAQDSSVAGYALGRREGADNDDHSPFARALLRSLDVSAAARPDGIITAEELIDDIRKQMIDDAYRQRNALGILPEQTPQLWPLATQDRGVFVFRRVGSPQLPPADKLQWDRNPYRGLNPYETKHRKLFFGRDDEIMRLVATVEKSPLVVVVGASGTGKSSLVRAGLLPILPQTRWRALLPLRPGSDPLSALAAAFAGRTETGDTDARAATENAYADTRALLEKIGVDALRYTGNADALAQMIGEWQASHPDIGLVLTIDQGEELLTMTATAEARAHFLALLRQALYRHPQTLRVLLTIRTDFEPLIREEFEPARKETDQVATTGTTAEHETSLWSRGRFSIAPLKPEELKEVIEQPASTLDLFFAETSVVTDLINDTLHMPGALPLLSFTLSEMFRAYIESGRNDREITRTEYMRVGDLKAEDEVGGVIGALRRRADEIYERLPDAAHAETMRRLMLRMVATDGGDLARRRVYEDELQYEARSDRRVQAGEIADPATFLAWLRDAPPDPVAGAPVSPPREPDPFACEMRHVLRQEGLAHLTSVIEAIPELPKRPEVASRNLRALYALIRWNFAKWRHLRMRSVACRSIAAAVNPLLDTLRDPLNRELRQLPPSPEMTEAQWQRGALRLEHPKMSPTLSETERASRANYRLLLDCCPPLRRECERVAFVKERLLAARLIVFGSEEVS